MTVLAAIARTLFAVDYVQVTDQAAAADSFRRAVIDVDGAVENMILATTEPNVWFHARIRSDNSGTSGTPIEFRGSAQSPVTIVDNAAQVGTNLAVRYWDGAAYQKTASFINTASEFTLDVNVNTAAGTFAIYVDGAQVLTGTFAAGMDITEVALTRMVASGDTEYSEIILATTTTVGARLAEIMPTANGAQQDQSLGDYLSIDGLLDGSLTLDAAADQFSAVVASPPTTPAGTEIAAVVVATKINAAAESAAVYINEGSITEGATFALNAASNQYQSVFAVTSAPTEIGVTHK